VTERWRNLFAASRFGPRVVTSKVSLSAVSVSPCACATAITRYPSVALGHGRGRWVGRSNERGVGWERVRCDCGPDEWQNFTNSSPGDYGVRTRKSRPWCSSTPCPPEPSNVRRSSTVRAGESADVGILGVARVLVGEGVGWRRSCQLSGELSQFHFHGLGIKRAARAATPAIRGIRAE